jgi:protein TonB
VKGHLTGFGVSALLHGALLLAAAPLLLWQNKLGLPEEQPLKLSLAQFEPAPPIPAPAPPESVAPPPVAQPKPEPPKPEPPKPEPKPPTKPKPVEKPKPAEKPVEKPKPKPKPEKQHEPPPEPAPVKAIAPASPAVARPAPRQLAATPPPSAKPIAPPAPVADNAAAEAAYRQKLQSLIAARKQYPRMAEKAEVEGTVTVSFTVLPNGTISGARVSQSSGNEWLDKAAVQAVNATSGALPFPAGIHKARWDFALKVNFKLDW